MAEVCQDCHIFKAFGRKCWYYWEEKKSCSQFRKSEVSEPEFKNA